MEYTVQEVAKLSGVTVKTLYHYQKIGLLMPKRIGENGYRYYSSLELEQLQQILLYRELDFPLGKIKEAMEDGTSRLRCLYEQKSMLEARQQRIGHILHTLEETIACTEKGVPMQEDRLFSGLNRQQWEQTLTPQSEYLKREYQYDMLAEGDIQPDALNQHADQVTQFMTFMVDALRQGIPPNAAQVRRAVQAHIDYVNKTIHPTDATSFLAQAEFSMADEFHRKMYENIQTGLCYFIFAAAKLYADSQ